MDKKSKSPLEEVIEFAKSKVNEGSKDVKETLEDEKKRIEEIIDFAKSKLNEANGDMKNQLNDIIKYSESKLGELEEKATDKAKEVADKVKKETEESSISDTITSAAKSVGTAISNIAKKFGKETGKISEIISIRSELNSLNNAKKEKIAKLGETLLNDYKNNPLGNVKLSDEMKKIIDEISEIESKIESKNAELEKIQRKENLTSDQIKEIEEIEKEKK